MKTRKKREGGRKVGVRKKEEEERGLQKNEEGKEGEEERLV